MLHTHSVRHLSVSIACAPARAYAFLCVPEHFCHWASGLAQGLREVDGEWLASTPSGELRVRFSTPNELGVLDHWVYLQPDAPLYIPLRLLANGTGCELVLSLYRQAEMSEAQFAADAEWVLRDLQTAKRLLEAL